MTASWEPSLAGRFFTWAKKWSIQLENDHVLLGSGHGPHHHFEKGLSPLRKGRTGSLWATVQVAVPDDRVIVPRMMSETLGFPIQVEDDPVLQLAMPNSESFEHAEERRLLYVALTRAQSSITLITIARKESPFVLELVCDHKLKATDSGNEDGQRYEVCGDGLLVPRHSNHGKFLGRTNYPRCTNTQRMQ